MTSERERWPGPAPLNGWTRGGRQARSIGTACRAARHELERGRGRVPYVRENVLRTAILLTVLSSLILAAGALAGGVDGLMIAVALAIGICGVAYFGSDRIALAVMRSRPVSEWEHPQLYRVVRELSTTARTPVPRLYVSPAIQPNAFATGRSRRRAAGCCTEGILQILD